LRELNDGLGADNVSTEPATTEDSGPRVVPGGSTNPVPERLPTEEAMTYLNRVGFADAEQAEFSDYERRLQRLTGALDDVRRQDKIRRLGR